MPTETTVFLDFRNDVEVVISNLYQTCLIPKNHGSCTSPNRFGPGPTTFHRSQFTESLCFARISLVNSRSDSTPRKRTPRVSSESNVIRSDTKTKICAYYREMLKSNPNNALLLRNYAKFLHEVEGDMVKADEYYGRAILASPGDGEVLSLYGKLIWETQRDEDRAQSYFAQAILASPNDCTVLGLYAQFMWEAEEEEEEEKEDGGDG